MGYMNKDNIFTFVQYACEGHKSNKLGEQTISLIFVINTVF